MQNRTGQKVKAVHPERCGTEPQLRPVHPATVMVELGGEGGKRHLR